MGVVIPPLHKSTFAVEYELMRAWHLVRITHSRRGLLGAWTLTPPALFFEIGHVPPLLSNFECLFLDHGIVGPLGELLGLTGLSPVFFGLACRHGTPAPKRIARAEPLTETPPAPGAKRGFAQTQRRQSEVAYTGENPGRLADGRGSVASIRLTEAVLNGPTVLTSVRSPKSAGPIVSAVTPIPVSIPIPITRAVIISVTRAIIVAIATRTVAAKV